MKTATVLMILCCSFGPGLAQAAADVAGHGEPWRLAQMSPEERRALRDQWRFLPPDERAALRQEFQERWRDIPPELREQRRRELVERWRQLPPEEREQRRREFQEQRGGYGQGFEYRRFEDEVAPHMPPPFPRRDGRR